MEEIPRGTAENVVAVRKGVSSLTGLWMFVGDESQRSSAGLFSTERELCPKSALPILLERSFS
jgi:hypothetical protein